MDYTTFILSNPPDNVDSTILADADRPQRTLSWQGYISALRRIAVGLRTVGVADQDGIGLLSSNDMYYYVLGEGAIAAGAAFAGIPTFVKQTELATAIEAAGLNWLFVSPDFLDLALATTQSLGFPVSNVIVFDPPGLDPYSGPQPSLSKLINAADESHFKNANQGKDPNSQIAFRLFTSGTTGSVKAAEVSHTQQIARAESMRSNPRPPYIQRALQTIGMYHISGLIGFHTATAGNATPLYYTAAQEAHGIVDTIQALKITSAMLSPQVLESISLGVAAGTLPREALASLRGITFGGSPCRREMMNMVLAALPSHTTLMYTYGSTEVQGVSITFIDAEWSEGCVGPPMWGSEVKILDPETFTPVSPGTQGEVCVRSSRVCSRYRNNPAANEASFLENGWFRTGDRGFIDPSSGFLTVTGRYKEIFKVRYEEVAPVEVEHELLKHPEIAEASVMSTPARNDPKNCECMAYIVRKEGSHLSAQQVVDYIASRLAPHKAPTGAVVFCAAMPRSALSKVIRGQLLTVPHLPGSAEFLAISTHVT